MKLKFDSTAKLIMNILKEHGYKAYIVGGCVRDLLMNITPRDYDIATNAKPDEIINIFEEEKYKKNGFKVFPTGIKYGTVTVVMGSKSYEITTFRGESDYKDSRRPSEVIFKNTIEEDLSRRDFTVNAMAYNEEDGLIDIFRGREDINNKLIRCVGSADIRFKEDALRILRAYRFASRYNFEIEKETLCAINNSLNLLTNISGERISGELKEIFENNYDIYKLSFINTVIPELKPCFETQFNEKETLGDYIFKSFNYVEPIFHLKLAVLLCNIDYFPGYNDNMADRAYVDIMRRLKLSNDVSNKVKMLIKYKNYNVIPDKTMLKKLMRDIGSSLTYDLIKIQIAFEKAENSESSEEKLSSLYNSLGLLPEAEKEPYTLSMLAVNGDDIKSRLNIVEGNEIGIILNKLLDIVIENYELNNKDYLMSKAEEYYEKRKIL